MHFLAITAIAQILEVSSAFYPEKNGIFTPDQSFILPSQNTWVQFGGAQEVNNHNDKSETELPENRSKKDSKIVCGPSPFINTMNCFSLTHVGFLKSIPIPGGVSATPVLAEHSWVVATTKGFLIRIKTKSATDDLPDIDPQNTELWGSHSRQVMDDFVPKTIYQEPGVKTEKTTQPAVQAMPRNYFWVFPASSPFVGTPVVHNGIVYALTANQSLYAIDFITGKFLWSTKIGPDVSFSLENVSLRVTDRFILIGTTRGHLLVLDPSTGNQIHDMTINNQEAPDDTLFAGVTAPPLILDEHNIIISNAVSETQRIFLETFQTVWTYPEGSITTPLILNPDTIIVTTSNGKVTSLNAQTGFVNWSKNTNKTSPLVDATFTNNKKTILVATKRGELIALDSATGKILTQNRAIGTTVGFFFKTPEYPHDSCLSFSTGSFRCFRVKI